MSAAQNDQLTEHVRSSKDVNKALREEKAGFCGLPASSFSSLSNTIMLLSSAPTRQDFGYDILSVM